MTETPDYHYHEEFQNRTKKLHELKELGIDPYPHHFEVTSNAQQLHQQYENEEIGHSDDAAAGTTPFVCLAGRIVLFRAMGKNAFAHLMDETGRIQVMFNREDTEVVGYTPPNGDPQAAKPIKIIEKKFDLGDIIGVEGYIFHTNKGELTIYAKRVTLLCKTLLPLADKHSGLHDKELRYRKRCLDLISNPEVKDTFRRRSEIFRIIRKYCEEYDFLEVETPVLQSIYGGAEARPFLTRLNALDQEMFMRISLEIPLKKLIIGGMGRVYEIGKVFRNEGIDRNHNPEFTLLEAYASYWDYHHMMEFVEKLYEKIALELYQTTKLKVADHESGEMIEIDVKAPWRRLSMKESLKEYANLDADNMSDEEMRQLLKESEHIDTLKLNSLSRGLLIAALFEVFVEPKLIQPHHITDHPVETTVLCKPHRHPVHRKDGLIERFESFIQGQEICNAYSELNDPELQRKFLMQQAERREAGDEEAAPIDEEFIEAICQGMPPTAGVGIGLDRLVMLFTNAHSIRDVLYFPWMKPVGAAAVNAE
ncbi:MAG: lysine--tRNA ligase [Chlamydiales bacterium]|nr:lysine--tRNA ligase [Chlamydiia bacterium]MCP5508156.1 lysine--tRNA ligase [Chlamydiales bacterium]